jgi:hypothetical protein
VRQKTTNVLILCALGVGLLWILAQVFRSRDPDVELLRVAQEAMRMARESRSEQRRSENLAVLVRTVALLGLVLGPVALAYLIYRSGSREEITLAEALEVLDEENLLPEDFDHPELPPGSPGESKDRLPDAK